MGVFSGLLCSGIAYFGLEQTVSHDGHMYYFYSTGMASYTASVCIGNLKVLNFSYIHTPVSLFFIFGEILFYIGTHALASTWTSNYIFGTF